MIIIREPQADASAGGPARKIKWKKKFRKSLRVPKIVAQCRKYPIPYLNTLNRTIPYAYTLPKAIAYLNTCIPILIHWLGFRLSAPYLNTCITYLNTLSRLSDPYLNTLPPILIHWVGFRLSAPYLNTLPILIHWVGSIS